LLLPTAEIEWIDGAPLSKVFGDVYFQTEGGLAESNYVFLEANKLKEKLLDTRCGNDALVIAETGFGSGLNFIACYALWCSLPEPKKRLEFISIEGFPLTTLDLKKSAKYFPELSSQYNELIEQYPAPIQGAHLLQFEQGRVRLRLVLDSLDNALDEYEIRADVWFLDGFAPKNNETMWSEKLFKYLGAHALAGTSLSTFSSASLIRKNLISAGFKVDKRSGYGPKREMITATFSLDKSEKPFTTPFQPWHLALPKTKSEGEIDRKSDRSVVVIGAGIAGLVQSLTLSRLGYDVKIVDSAPLPLAGASAQPQLIMYAKYPRQVNAEGKLLLHAHHMAQSYYTREQNSSLGRFWHPIGLTQLAWTDAEELRQNDFLRNYGLPKNFVEPLSAKELSLRSGIKIESPGLFFEQSGWLDTQAFAEFVLQQHKVQFIGNTQATDLKRSRDKHWLVHTNNQTLTSKHVVLCNAYGVNHLIPDLELPLKQLRGQTSQLICEELAELSCVVCGEGYLSPCADKNGELHIGATYDLNNMDSNYREEDNNKNVEQLEKWLKGWSKNNLSLVAGGKAGLRTTSADYTPIAGPVPSRLQIIEELSELATNAKACQSKYGVYEEGLYLNAAYGSKGLTFAPMCADMIASHISGTPIGNPHQMQKMLSPARFLIRKLKKGLIKA
jgi:tRNA 5-methylaminomethyl-2-thiouridine biosynthesis bifunctional protein